MDKRRIKHCVCVLLVRINMALFAAPDAFPALNGFLGGRTALVDVAYEAAYQACIRGGGAIVPI